MHDSEYTGPTWPTFFVTPDQLEAAMAHPDYSTFVPMREKTHCIDGYLVTFGRPSLLRGASILNARRERYEAAKRAEQRR